MKQLWKRLGALALAGVLLALSACGGRKDGNGEPSGTGAAMGRYIEEEFQFPEDAGYIRGPRQMADGSLRMLCSRDPEAMMNKWDLYRSDDGGRSWTREDAPWLEGLGELVAVSGADWDADGNLYLYYMAMTQEEFDAEMARMAEGEPEEPEEDASSAPEEQPGGASAPEPAETPAPDGAEPEEDPFRETLIKVDPSGSVQTLDFQLEAVTDNGTIGARSFQIADNGDIIADCYFSLAQFDPATGEQKHLYEPENFSNSTSFVTFGSTLAMTDGDDIVYYDIGTGERVNSFSATGASEAEEGKKTAVMEDSASYSRVLAMDPAKTAVYFADKTGVYRRLIDGSVTERLIDGELCSLNMPSLQPDTLIVREDGGILLSVFGSGAGSYTMMNYTYSADTPAVPTKELRVFSLYDDMTVRQAMGLFQRQNPDVHVVYDVAMTGDDAVTTSDALRTLSTELLADKGPDLLVLDGMPVDSYVEKGVLLDLAPLAGEKASSGEWLKNQAGSFQTADGKIYAVPARFSVPVILAQPAAAGAKDLTALSEWLTTQAGRFAGEHEGALSNLYPAALMELFYPVCAPAWFHEDGSLDEEAFRSFLSDIKRLSDSAAEEQGEEGKAQYEYVGSASYDLLWDGLRWAYKTVGAASGSLDSVGALAAPEACIAKRGEGRLAPLPGQVDGVFVPRTILGVNANGKQTEMARAFLELALSEQVQKNNFDDGMPVNAKAFSDGFINPNPDDPDGRYYSSSWTAEDGTDKSLELHVTWPPEAFMADAKSWITSLDTPSNADEVVRQMILSETAGYFDGTQTLDEAVGALREKLNIYLAE